MKKRIQCVSLTGICLLALSCAGSESWQTIERWELQGHHEKALKAAVLKIRGTFPKGHSLRQLAEAAGLFEKAASEVSLLEGDYTLSRYPDAYGKPPRALYDSKAFAKRLDAARKIVKLVGE